VAQGRTFQQGLSELIVGKNATNTYSGLKIGDSVNMGGGHWKVVGVFDAGGSSFDSEVWCDAKILSQVLQRPANIFQSATVHLTSPAAFQQFKDSVTSDPRLTVDATREVDYYAKQSTTMTRLITVLGGIVALIMSVGAAFGVRNNIDARLSERGREISITRALWVSMLYHLLHFLFLALLHSI